MLPNSIVRAKNDLLFTDTGGYLIDLFSAHGAVLLGHAHPQINAAIAAQLNDCMLLGSLPTPIAARARSELEEFFPSSLKFGGLYTTGMEVAEFAFRLARVTTGKTGVIGFENSMHGKSLATANLTWHNRYDIRVPGFHRLPFLQTSPEDEILEKLENCLQENEIGAVFVEPIQGSNGGRFASDFFYHEVARMTSENKALLVFDEVLTGFYRTGTPFRCQALDIAPDIVLFGKACGNGFPVSGIMMDRKLELQPEMFPGSTFSGNPLACSAVSATIQCIKKLNLPEMVAKISEAVNTHFAWLQDNSSLSLRGKGALWVIELPEGFDGMRLVRSIYEDAVCVGFSGRQLRIMPAATIEETNLHEALQIVSSKLQAAFSLTRH